MIPSDSAGKSKYFEGLPIPSSLGLTSMMAYWVHRGWFGVGGVPWGVLRLWGGVGGGGEVHVASFVFVAWGAMMVSKTLKVGSRLRPVSRALCTIDGLCADLAGAQAIKHRGN